MLRLGVYPSCAVVHMDHVGTASACNFGFHTRAQTPVVLEEGGQAWRVGRRTAYRRCEG